MLLMLNQQVKNRKSICVFVVVWYSVFTGICLSSDNMEGREITVRVFKRVSEWQFNTKHPQRNG